MTKPRLVSTLAVLAVAIAFYVAMHRLVPPSVGADIAIIGAVILMLAVLPGYLTKTIKHRADRTARPSRDLPAS